MLWHFHCESVYCEYEKPSHHSRTPFEHIDSLGLATHWEESARDKFMQEFFSLLSILCLSFMLWATEQSASVWSYFDCCCVLQPGEFSWGPPWRKVGLVHVVVEMNRSQIIRWLTTKTILSLSIGTTIDYLPRNLHLLKWCCYDYVSLIFFLSERVTVPLLYQERRGCSGCICWMKLHLTEKLQEF